MRLIGVVFVQPQHGENVMAKDGNQDSSRQSDASNSPRQATPDSEQRTTPLGMRLPKRKPSGKAGKNPIIIYEDKGRA